MVGGRSNPDFKAGRENLRELLKSGGQKGIAWGYPDASGRGGGSATSQSARQFFKSRELRERVISFVPEKDRDHLRFILQNTGILLRVMECDQKVDTQKVRDLSRKVMLRFADHYPWVEIQDTTHELYAHLAQFIGIC